MTPMIITMIIMGRRRMMLTMGSCSMTWTARFPQVATKPPLNDTSALISFPCTWFVGWNESESEWYKRADFFSLNLDCGLEWKWKWMIQARWSLFLAPGHCHVGSWVGIKVKVNDTSALNLNLVNHYGHEWVKNQDESESESVVICVKLKVKVVMCFRMKVKVD